MTSDSQVPPKHAPRPTSAGPADQTPRPTPAGPVEQPPDSATPPPTSAVPFTRVAAAWWALAFGLLILIVLLVFVAQNTDSITIRFLAWQWSSPTGIAFLLAAVGGALVTVAAGTARMVQLRRAAKKNLEAHVGHRPPN